MIYSATTFKYVFNCYEEDIFFCTADLGWITGHTVNCYGSLANAATIVLFEGTPFYPHAGRLWEIVDKLRVSIFYTAPTAIRSLMKYGDEIINKYSLRSLKMLGTAGEPINPEAWCWYYKVIGKGRCPIVDTFWQTETVWVPFDRREIVGLTLNCLGCSNVDSLAGVHTAQAGLGNISLLRRAAGDRRPEWQGDRRTRQRHSRDQEAMAIDRSHHRRQSRTI